MEVLDAQEEIKVHELKYAGFWIRTAAALIDSFISVLVLVGTLSVAVWSGNFPMAREVSEDNVAQILLIAYGPWILIMMLYFAVMESSWKQGSLGKIIVGIKVGTKDGQRISFLHALARYFSKILSALIFYIGFIAVAFDSRKQGVHDMITNTFVFYR